MLKIMPVEGKPFAFTVFRDCDKGEAWHPKDMVKRYAEQWKNKQASGLFEAN